MRGHCYYWVIRHGSTRFNIVVSVSIIYLSALIVLITKGEKIAWWSDEQVDCQWLHQNNSTPKKKKVDVSRKCNKSLYLYCLLYTVVLALPFTTLVEWHWNLQHNCWWLSSKDLFENVHMDNVFCRSWKRPGCTRKYRLGYNPENPIN